MRSFDRSLTSTAPLLVDDTANAAPQAIWRTTPVSICNEDDAKRIRGLLRGIGMLDQPRWPEAARGEPADAIAVANDIANPDDGPTPQLDLAMSALFACVIDGDTAARLMFGLLVRRLDWVAGVEVEPVDLYRLMSEGIAS